MTLSLSLVIITSCNDLTEIEITRRIDSFTIQNCLNLKEISGKDFVTSYKD
jgi:hypothetical protein